MAKQKNRQKKWTPAYFILFTLVTLTFAVLKIYFPGNLEFYLKLGKNEVTNQTVTIENEKKNPGPIEEGKAVFLPSELKNTKNSWITYHPLDHLGRATGMDALLKNDRINTGTRANKDIRPPGFISGLDPYNHSRGHLLGRQLGGSGDNPKNLVTLYQNPVNTPYMTKYENAIREALENNETVRYRVIPIYSENKLMCSEITLDAKSLTNSNGIDFHVTILNEK